jgi:hypothetical protein
MSEINAEYAETPPDDLDIEAEIDELPDEPRGETPLEANPADAVEQHMLVELDEDEYR